MKTSNGFILLSQLIVFLLCLILLTSAVLAYNRSLKLYQKSKKLESAIISAQLQLEDCEPFTTINLTTNNNHPFKEVQIKDDKTIVLNLIIFEY